MKTKTLGRRLLYGGLILPVAGVAGYYGWALQQANEYTQQILLPRLAQIEYPLGLDDFSQYQLELLLKVEDPNFFNHGGVDFMTPGAGITTITQSLVKQLYFERFKPGIAKIKQSLIADFVLDEQMPKADQLQLFTNTVYLGEGIKGFAQAAEYYFQKPFTSLNDDEYTALVAMIIAPQTFHLQRYPKRNQTRVERIKQLIADQYQPKGLFDLYYGKLDKEAQLHLPKLSYFPSYYR